MCGQHVQVSIPRKASPMRQSRSRQYCPRDLSIVGSTRCDCRCFTGDRLDQAHRRILLGNNHCVGMFTTSLKHIICLGVHLILLSRPESHISIGVRSYAAPCSYLPQPPLFATLSLVFRHYWNFYPACFTSYHSTILYFLVYANIPQHKA